LGISAKRRKLRSKVQIKPKKGKWRVAGEAAKSPIELSIGDASYLAGRGRNLLISGRRRGFIERAKGKILQGSKGSRDNQKSRSKRAGKGIVGKIV